LFDGIEVGAVGRQKEEFSAGCTDGAALEMSNGFSSYDGEAEHLIAIYGARDALVEYEKVARTFIAWLAERAQNLTAARHRRRVGRRASAKVHLPLTRILGLIAD
jgi:hypothetical protein